MTRETILARYDTRIQPMDEPRSWRWLGRLLLLVALVAFASIAWGVGG